MSARKFKPMAERVLGLGGVFLKARDPARLADEQVEDSGYGRFGWVTDPEGNRIELWQPTAP
jgi:predicted enzyme related to lactoylglutathione lyase